MLHFLPEALPQASLTAMSLTTLADENIPLVHEAFAPLGTVHTTAGRSIHTADLSDVDVLLVRSVTTVDANLIGNTPLQFVGSATIGTDHIDQALLDARGIPFAHAPGSNADSVADYVIAALLQHAVCTQTELSDCTIGVVGCGNTGSRVARRCEALGCTVLRNDPPRAVASKQSKQAAPFVSLSTLLAAADIVSLHVPLTHTGAHPTHHLIDADALNTLHCDAWLVNTSRGGVVDANALQDALQRNQLGAALLDVWPNEPTPPLDLVSRAAIATPHIAGYAYDGKIRGTYMLYTALCRVLDQPSPWTPRTALARHDPDTWMLSPPDARFSQTEALHALARQAYAIANDDARLRAIRARPSSARAHDFSTLRRTYPMRREMQCYQVPVASLPADWHHAVANGLTMRLV